MNRSLMSASVPQQLAESLAEFGTKWDYNPGDGAFYGPKVKVYISILLKEWCCDL